MKTTVAIAQFAPEYGNFEKGVKKAVKIIKEASKEGVRLLVFPELWFLGYPYWASMGTRNPVFHAWLNHFLAEAGGVDDPRLNPVLRAARQHKMAISFSIHEQQGGSLYNTLLLCDPSGKIVTSHRKLVPTNTERLIHGRGDGSDMSVHDFGFGRISGLLCFEHQMTLVRAAIGSLQPQIHCAQWPGQAFIGPIIDASMRQFAHENGCFVLSAREVMSADRLPSKNPGVGDDETRWDGVGGSSIAGPFANYLVEPAGDAERLLVAELDLDMIKPVKYLIDNQGHYARPDVFQLTWNDLPKPIVIKKSGA
jgi:nitrilase